MGIATPSHQVEWETSWKHFSDLFGIFLGRAFYAQSLEMSTPEKKIITNHQIPTQIPPKSLELIKPKTIKHLKSLKSLTSRSRWTHQFSSIFPIFFKKTWGNLDGLPMAPPRSPSAAPRALLRDGPSGRCRWRSNGLLPRCNGGVDGGWNIQYVYWLHHVINIYYVYIYIWFMDVNVIVLNTPYIYGYQYSRSIYSVLTYY